MLPRRRPAAAAPGPADRVQRVLGVPGGWVPPPDDAPEQVPALDGGAVRDEDVRDEDVPRGAVPGGVVPGGVVPGGVVPDEELPLERSWSPAPGRPDDEPAVPVGRPGLRAALAAGRLDPGRRGAAALVVVALLAAVVAGVVVRRGQPQEVLAPQVVATGVPLAGSTPQASAVPAEPGGEVVVAVAGKVARPGLVRLPAGSRVDDALRAAGGPLPGAGPGLLNLARRLVDGEQVLVGVDPPPGAVPAPAGPPSAGGAPAGGPVDLNLATAADLDALPGLGPVLAQRIVDWRTEHGRFASVEQLREVTGIGEAKFEDLRDRVTV